MDGLFRCGGVRHAKTAVPHQLRHAIGKTALVASTGAREPALARVVAAELLAGWRRRLLDPTGTRRGPLGIERIALGHSARSGGGYPAVAEAASASGINESYLVGKAADGELRLDLRCTSIPDIFALKAGSTETSAERSLKGAQRAFATHLPHVDVQGRQALAQVDRRLVSVEQGENFLVMGRSAARS